jgi:hypothetical protein
MLVFESRTSSANGAFGRHERQDNAGMRLVTAASWCRSSVRRSIALVMRQAGQRTHKNQWRAVTAAPIVGENSIGMRFARRSFQSAISRSASYLRIQRAPCSGFLLGSPPPLVIHFAAVEAHSVMVRC